MALTRSSLGRGNKRVILQAPTGFGKTVLMSHIAAGALARGNRVIITVPSISLIDQTVESLGADGLYDVGVIQSNHPLTDSSQPIQVASVQSLMKRNLNRIEANLVLVDEAHRWFKFYADWMSSWSLIPFIGLSATPWTKGLAKHYDDLIIASTTQELIDAGYLAPFQVFAPAHPDLKGVRTVAGDYHEGDLAAAMMRGALVADIVTTWQARGENRPTLAFGVDRAHAAAIQAQFLQAGVPCGYIDSYTTREERQAIADEFHAGRLKVVANVGCLTTGVDWDVRCIILARPTKSEMLFVQIIGRGLRTADGKRDCLILDHSDTHLRLGFVTDIEHLTLDDGNPVSAAERVKDEPLPKECPACAFLRPARVALCPACGFKPERQSDVATVAGELEELIPAAKRKLNRDATPEQKIAFYGGLRQYAIERGYKSGWAANQYKSKFGVWPNAYADAPPVPPSQDVIGWVRHSQIKYAKRRSA